MSLFSVSAQFVVTLKQARKIKQQVQGLPFSLLHQEKICPPKSPQLLVMVLVCVCYLQGCQCSSDSLQLSDCPSIRRKLFSAAPYFSFDLFFATLKTVVAEGEITATVGQIVKKDCEIAAGKPAGDPCVANENSCHFL